MSTFTKVPLSGSTDYAPIKITTTASAGDTIHTADATAQDEIWLYVYNSDTVSRTVTAQFGGTTSPDNDIKALIPSRQGLYLLVPGIPLRNSKVLKVWGETANVLTVSGFVNRIS